MTINYIEKGIGLHDAISAAGHSLRQLDGVWVSDNDVAVQAIIDSYSPVPDIQAQVDVIRDSKIALGVPIVFPDGSSGTAQTRESDKLNINGLVTSSLILKSQGVTGAVVPYRDLENITHMLSPDQMIQIGMDILNKISAVYQSAWAIKSAVASAADPMAYDITAGWPV